MAGAGVVEAQPVAVQAHQLQPIASYPQAISMDGPRALHLATPAAQQTRGLRWRLDYVEYRTAQGATQFMRYARVREEPLSEEEPR